MPQAENETPAKNDEEAELNEMAINALLNFGGRLLSDHDFRVKLDVIIPDITYGQNFDLVLDTIAERAMIYLGQPEQFAEIASYFSDTARTLFRRAKIDENEFPETVEALREIYGDYIEFKTGRRGVISIRPLTKPEA